MFVKFIFSDKQINNYFQSARRDLALASSPEPEVKFLFSYNCLLKAAQAVCAYHGLRVKSDKGHHAALLAKYSEFLKDEKISALGQAMRDKRNRDLYDGGTVITKKEAETYYQLTKKLISITESYLSPDKLT